MAFADYASRLMGQLPQLDYLLAQSLINEAWQDIRDARFWSFLRGFGVLVAPQNITTGTVTVVQFSPTVNLDTAANTALDNLQNPMITSRQFRCAQGPLYNIVGYDDVAKTLTLDRPYMEQNLSGAPYSVYRCYYSPADASGNPIQDFLKFKSILNPIAGYAIVGERLNITRQELDRRDPTRGSQDLLYCMAAFNVDGSGIPIYEAWPHPTSAQAYPYLYQRRGLDLSSTVDLPATFNKNVLIEHAFSFAYDWAITNAGRFPTLKGTNWALLKAESNRKYDKMLQAAKMADDNLLSENFIPQFANYMTPIIDSKFLQSHSWGNEP